MIPPRGLSPGLDAPDPALRASRPLASELSLAEVRPRPWLLSDLLLLLPWKYSSSSRTNSGVLGVDECRLDGPGPARVSRNGEGRRDDGGEKDRCEPADETDDDEFDRIRGRVRVSRPRAPDTPGADDESSSDASEGEEAR